MPAPRRAPETGHRTGERNGQHHGVFPLITTRDVLVYPSSRRVGSMASRDERQGWHLPPTRGGRCDGGVNAAAARADRARALPGRARPSAPDVRRRACWVGAEAGRAMRATGATSRGISMVDGWGESPAATGASPMAARPPS